MGHVACFPFFPFDYFSNGVVEWVYPGSVVHFVGCQLQLRPFRCVLTHAQVGTTKTKGKNANGSYHGAFMNTIARDGDRVEEKKAWLHPVSLFVSLLPFVRGSNNRLDEARRDRSNGNRYR